MHTYILVSFLPVVFLNVTALRMRMRVSLGKIRNHSGSFGDKSVSFEMSGYVTNVVTELGGSGHF